MTQQGKPATMKELAAVMHGFARSMARIYNQEAIPALLGIRPEQLGIGATKPEDCDFSGTALWRAVSDMYDYGIEGKPLAQFGSDRIGGIYADAELALEAIRTNEMQIYLDAEQAPFPSLAIQAVRTAVARHILEGGERYIDYDAIDEGDYGPGHLSIKEISLLANMDERSVRNACNPKLDGGLKTVQIDKRTMVEPAEARRWLSGRKGYVPLQSPLIDAPSLLRTSLELPTDLVRALRGQAERRGMTVDGLITKLVESGDAK